MQEILWLLPSATSLGADHRNLSLLLGGHKTPAAPRTSITGSGTEGMRSSYGSMMMAKPLAYVPTSVAKSATCGIFQGLQQQLDRLGLVLKPDTHDNCPVLRMPMPNMPLVPPQGVTHRSRKHPARVFVPTAHEELCQQMQAGAQMERCQLLRMSHAQTTQLRQHAAQACNRVLDPQILTPNP